jgi:predicted nucleic acid-binding protein
MHTEMKRVYVDTSVVGGKFDNVHALQTKPFWDAVQEGKIVIIVSDILAEEVGSSPQHVQDFFTTLPKSQIERIVSTNESDNLAAQYIAAKIVGEKSLNDCRHIALATVARADVIVSWNCKDIVNARRIPKYNDINEQQGYPRIEIQTPYKFMEANHEST